MEVDYPTGCTQDDTPTGQNIIDEINFLKLHSEILNKDDSNGGPVEIYFKLIDILPKPLTINDLTLYLINRQENTSGCEKQLLEVIILVHIYIGLTTNSRACISDYQDIKNKIEDYWEEYIKSLLGES
jgi:hypothetical protein